MPAALSTKARRAFSLPTNQEGCGFSFVAKEK
jgi:hypothetical protein